MYDDYIDLDLENQLKFYKKEILVYRITFIIGVPTDILIIFSNYVNHGPLWAYFGSPLFISSILVLNYLKYKGVKKKRDEILTQLLINS
jgi:hypothetical protein